MSETPPRLSLAWYAQEYKRLSAEITSLRSQLAKLEAEKEAGDFWRGVFDSITDKTDREKIEAELSDFHFVMQQVPDVYMHITGGKLSKCNYYAAVVIAEADEYSNRFVDEAAEDTRHKAIEECAKVAESFGKNHGVQWGDRKRFELHDVQRAVNDACSLIAEDIRALLSESKT